MYPELFPLGDFIIHTYGFLIMIGAIAAYGYFFFFGRRELNIKHEDLQNLVIMLVLAAFLGGKLLFYLEDPGYYFGDWSRMMDNFRNGFVFYGSLVFAVPVAIWFFRKYSWPLWPLLDRLAIAILIVHIFGRLGCFFAGCCYGLPFDGHWAVTFTDTASQAPLHTALHPTQLYAVILLVSILLILLMLDRHKRFQGQLFLIYLILYAIGRGVIEIFRGDLRRGFVFDDWLSHSQAISLVVIAVVLIVYYQRLRRLQAP